MVDRSMSEPAKIKALSLKRKAPSSESKSSVKSKRFKPDDASSVLTLTPSVAFGAYEDLDQTDSEDDLLSTTGSEKPFLQLDTSLLSRDYGVLFSEDLMDDYEIWTMQCPDDVDINELKNQTINFNELSSLKVNNSLSNKIDVVPYRSDKDTNITLVIPSENTKKLSLNVVPLTGSLVMSNRVRKEKITNYKLLPVDTIKDATRRRSELMSKITQRLSNKFDTDTEYNPIINKQIKVEKESPRKVKKNKVKLSK